jgi:glycosyltransferase involved in cell wall biosynthesis
VSAIRQARARAPKAGREAVLAALRIDGALRNRDRRPHPSDNSRLRILACTPTYLPGHRRGAEVTLHAVLTALRDRGHEVRLFVDGTTPYEIDGLMILGAARGRAALEAARRSDVVLGQLASRWTALTLGARSARPVVHYMHIGGVARRSLYGHPDLTIFSSAALRQDYTWIEPGVIVHPPIVETEYLTTPGDAITMVNLIPDKGSTTFYELARRLSERQFLGVKGTGPQDIPVDLPPNVTVIEQVEDMRDVYGRTRILLMPSVYESFGRVPLEAAVSGIPTIAHPSSGVREAMGDAALWAARDAIEAWVEHIESLDDPQRYRDRSARCRERFDQLDPKEEIDALERALLDLAVHGVV